MSTVGQPRMGSIPEGRRGSTHRCVIRVVSLALRRRWANLMRRVYELDPLPCPRCGAQMRLIGLTEPSVIKRILDHARRRDTGTRGGGLRPHHRGGQDSISHRHQVNSPDTRSDSPASGRLALPRARTRRKRGWGHYGPKRSKTSGEAGGSPLADPGDPFDGSPVATRCRRGAR
jgi:hypothetical protein